MRTPVLVESRDGFSRDAARALASLQDALARVLGTLPSPPESAADLARVLGLNRKIAWQVWRIVESEPGETPAQVLPGPAAMEGFLLACGRAGVAQDRLAAAREALRRFDDLAVLHGGDRTQLMSLLRQSSSGTSADDRASETIRRQAYLAGSEIWGVQTQAYFATAILAPGVEEGRVDDLSLAGEVGVRRLRADAVRVISGLGFRADAQPKPGGGTDRPTPRVIAEVEPGSGLMEPMVPRFSSARVRVAAGAAEGPGQSRVELVESPVGRRGEVDFVMAQFCPNVGRRHASETLKRVHFAVHLFSAYAVCVHDLLVRRDLWPDAEPSAKVYSALRGMMTSQAKRDERDVLPIRADVKRLGAGLSVLPTPHVPNYLEIVDWACSRVGWKPEQFDAYRCVVAYPPMPSTIVMGVDLPSI